jgi:hypothetical protein
LNERNGVGACSLQQQQQQQQPERRNVGNVSENLIAREEKNKTAVK